MQGLANEFLNRVRTSRQALADLVAKYNAMRFDHPDRPELAQMIRQLETEIGCRNG
jgi:hypothetical protein